MEDPNEVEGEVQLARITLQIYEVMIDYCHYIHSSFSEMLKNSDDIEMDEDDKLLVEWMREQVSVLENIFSHHQVRKEIIEQIMTDVLAQSNRGETVH